MELFGYTLTKSDEVTEKDLQTFSSKETNDGTVEVDAAVDFAGMNKYILDLDTEFVTEKERIDTYRNAAKTADLSIAIDEIVNDAVVIDNTDDIVDIQLDETEFSDNIKEKIVEEFEYLLSLMDFNRKGDDMFKRWYIDGKYYMHKVMGKKDGDGIAELRYLDPRRIKKVRETVKDTHGIKTIEIKEYYVYSLNDLNDDKKISTVYGTDKKALEIETDMIAYAHSGLVVEGSTTVDSYLQKSLKPLNQLMNLEDSVVVYRVSRAPERRIFYIDVGNLPKTRAEQYMKNIIAKYKNNTVYDAQTGTFANNKNHVSMLEDIWLPRREGSRGTEVSTLPGGQSLGELDDVMYFRKKLFKALHLPVSRLDSEAAFNLGRASEITRDEIKFGKFIAKLQSQFIDLFYDILRTQLVLKKIITDEDWVKNKYDVKFQFNTDSYFTELKKSELLTDRINLLDSMSEHIGKYFSVDFVQKEVLMMSEEEIKETEKEITQNIKDGKLPDPSKQQEDEF